MATSDTAQRISNVMRMIHSAFGAIVCPKGDDVVHPSTYDDGEVDAFTHPMWTDWREVPHAGIAENYAALVFFSPKAFQFYVPAYMTLVLKHLDPQQAVVGHVVHHLCLATSGTDPELRAEKVLCYELLTPDQKRAVLAFLETIRDHVGISSLRKEAADGVRDYWQQFR